MSIIRKNRHTRDGFFGAYEQAKACGATIVSFVSESRITVEGLLLINSVWESGVIDSRLGENTPLISVYLNRCLLRLIVTLKAYLALNMDNMVIWPVLIN